MSFVQGVSDTQATGRALELFDEDRKKDGYVWNLTRVLALRPAAVDAAARSFFCKTLDAMGVQPDAQYRSLDEPLRVALTVGRPIAQGENRS